MPFPLLIGRYEPEFLVRLLPPAFTAVGTGKKQLVKTLEEKQFPQHYYPHGTPATEEAGADKEKTETSTTPVAEDAPKNKVLKEQHLVIGENQKGISFDELFGPYLKGASKLTITDAYLRKFHQLRNLMELLETVTRLKPDEEEVEVHLITVEDEFNGDQQKGHLMNIQENIWSGGIQFSWEF